MMMALTLTGSSFMSPIDWAIDWAGGGGGAKAVTVGGVSTVSTLIETPVTFASMAVALLGLLVAVAIVECTEAAVARGVRMLTPTMTLPAVTVNSTADGPTPARAAIALFIWSSTLEVNEETSPARRRLNPTTLIVGGGDGGGGEGEGGRGEGDGGGGDGDRGGGDGDGGSGRGEGGGGEGDGGGGEGESVGDSGGDGTNVQRPEDVGVEAGAVMLAMPKLSGSALAPSPLFTWFPDNKKPEFAWSSEPHSVAGF